MTNAIILTGHLRMWQACFPNFKERFIDVFNPDIFISTWKYQNYWAPHSVSGIGEDGPIIVEEDVRNAFNPIDLVIEDYKDFEPIFAERAKNFTNFYHRRRNIISMFYKLGSGIQLLEKHVMQTGKQYDLVIRMRNDMIFHQPLPDFDPLYFYTVADRNHMGKGTGDTIQAGSMKHMCQFSKIGMNLESLYAETGLLCPHELSQHYIEKLWLPWKHLNPLPKTLMHSPNGPYQPS